MSEVTPDVTTATTDKATKPRKAKAERVDFSVCITRHSSRRGIDTTRGGKEFRAIARREFDKIAANDPTNYGPKGKIKQRANDGNRWGTMNSKNVELLLTRKGRK